PLPPPPDTSQAPPPGEEVRSTSSPYQPRYSPDGEKIAFSSNRSGSLEIWVCDSTGKNPVRLTSIGYATAPQWSPDGAFISFEGRTQGRVGVYVVGAGGGPARRLSTGPANDYEPVWSPDGNWIFVSSDRSGERQLWKMPATANSASDEAVQITADGCDYPLASLDGRTVYYIRRQGSRYSVCSVAGSGGEEKELVHSVYRSNAAIVEEGIYFSPPRDPALRTSIELFRFDTAETER
ncbi:MAG: hypothetical protein GY953_47030, partial [bacterium]|nr:hypothetical protein [bacterium]